MPRNVGGPRAAVALTLAMLAVSSLPAGAKAPARPAQTAKPAKPAKQAPANIDREAAARLGRGYRLYVAGDYSGALRELRPLAAARLHARDYALYLLGQSAALAGHGDEALRHFRALAALQQSPPGRFAALARARAADIAYELGQYAAAQQGYREILKQPAPEVEPAVARWRLADIAVREKRAGDAAGLLRELFTSSPEHPLAERALERLRTLDSKFTVDPRDHVARARRLTAERYWQRALDELALVPKDAPPPVRDEADYWIGSTHFRMRRGYDVAAQKLLAVADRMEGERRTEALFHGARAWSRADQDDRAIEGYRDLVHRFPRAREAPEASFLIGWLEYNRGAYAKAIPNLETTLRDYGSSKFGDDARWYLGFSRWLMGDVAGALADFDLLGRRNGAYVGAKGRYWKGRALEQLGRKAEAEAVWRKVVAEYPLSYYAIQSRARLKDANVDIHAFGGADLKAAGVPALGAVDERLASDPGIARADELLEAGLTVEAGVELDRIDGAFIKSAGAARALPLLLDRYHKAENWFRTHRLAEAHSGGALRVDPHADNAAGRAARAWWSEIYPLAYRRHVERYGPTGNNPKYYLYTIMQKESAYNPHDVSYADAIGLLQMIPPTSRRVGERIGRPYTDDVLYDPEGNIQLGAWYIGHLLEKFKGQVALGAGSYNAGPRAMMKWVKLHGARPLDEFIELCAYTQTREYMKKALDIYAHYLYLYEKEQYLPESKIDVKYLDNEIDY